MAHRVLLVEDEHDLATPLVATLRTQGYDVAWEDHGADVPRLIASWRPDLVVLDRRLPDADGLEICRTVRAAGFAGAVLMLTAQASEIDQVYGLDSGADDYLAKPFGVATLLARIRALLRRVGPAEREDRRLVIRPAARRALVGGAPLDLSGRELDLLTLLHRSAGQVVTRHQIADQFWDGEWYGSPRALDVAVGRLRRKLAAAGAEVAIVTVRGAGFRLEPREP